MTSMPVKMPLKNSESSDINRDSSELKLINLIEPNIQPIHIDGIFGSIDSLSSTGASGWVIDVAQPDKSLKVSAYVNDTIVGTTITNLPRPDISNIIQGTAECGFRLHWDKEEFVRAVAKLQLNQPCPIEIRPEGDTRAIVSASVPLVNDVYSWFDIELINGHLDRVETDLVATGWAINPIKEGPANVEILIDGTIVAEGIANLARPDFVLLYPENVMSGFKIQIPRKAITHLYSELEVVVDGYLLPCPAIKLDFSKQVKVAITKFENGELYIEATGWPGDTLEGELHIDGQKAAILILGAATHDKSATTKKLEGRWKIADDLIDRQPHVYVFMIQHKNAVVRSDATIMSYPQYSIHIDKANLNTISGWAFRHDKATPLQLRLTGAGELIDQSSTNILRMDVHQEYPLSPVNSGFEFILPVHKTHTAEFELIDVETNLTIADIAVARPYEALACLANELATSTSDSAAVILRTLLPDMIMRANSDSSYSFKFPHQHHKRTDNPDEVAIIIPIYGGAVETVECLESVLTAENITPARIIVINDCTPDPQIKNYLASLEKRGLEDMVIIHRMTNGGFSQAVNIGMIAAGNRDVILLNADTVVQSGWIDRLVAAAHSSPRIGTVTPMSNNAEICTVPYSCKSLPVSDQALAIEVDRAAMAVNAGKVVDIPVAIGFCMYIGRACIDDIGLFDAATWGRGYGEEVDFCLKAAARGWRHVMTGDTFVVHRGNVSFGNEKFERIKESAKKISERYPFYDRLIQRFLATDPGASIRRSINLKLVDNALPKKRILHITHGFGGGTSQYVKDMVILNIEAGYTPLILHFMDNGTAELDIELSNTGLVGFFANNHKENYSADEVKDLKEDIAKLGFEHLHIHAPFGMPNDLLEYLINSFDYYVTIHDYAWICPRVTLTLPGGRYCGEPEVTQCNTCISLYQPHTGLKILVDEANGDISTYRLNFSRVIEKAQIVFAGAQDVINRMQHHGIHGNFKRIPHPVPVGSPFHKQTLASNTLPADGVIKVAVIGGISDIKGFYMLEDCAKQAEQRRLPIRFLIFGTTMNDALLKKYKTVEMLGAYKEEELDLLIQAYSPQLAFFPNQWPETFSYTLSHAFRLGIWPVATDIGAPAERIKSHHFGTLLPVDSNIESILNSLLDTATMLISNHKLTTPSIDYPETYSEYFDITDSQSTIR